MSTSVEVRMPRLTESMAEGVVTRWLQAAGSTVGAGDELAEIETDKAIVAVAAESTGTLEIVVPEGDSAAVGAVIARIGARRAVSPLARRRARELGVDFATVRGSGPGGRVVRADVEAAAQARGTDPEPVAVPPPAASRPTAPLAPSPVAPARRGTSTEVLLTRVQEAGVRRLAAAAAVPTFALTAEVDTAALARLRADLAEVADPAPTVTDLIVAAAGRALREFPRCNASAADGAVLVHDRVGVGIAVDTPEGLVVPVVPDADAATPTAVAALTRELVARARAGRSSPADLDGATFTVSNLGMLGVVSFEAVLVPPQAAILAVGATRELPRVRAGAVVPVPVAALTLTCDHRVLDGAYAARFLARVVALLERPLALFVEGGTP